MINIDIPGHKTTSKRKLPLVRAINVSASRFGTTPEAMAIAMSYVFEAITDEIANGEPVIIPNFGSFIPVAKTVKGKKNGGARRARPYFTGARTFQYYIASACPLYRAEKNLDLLYKSRKMYNCGDPSKVKGVNANVSQGMDKWRSGLWKRYAQSGITGFGG